MAPHTWSQLGDTVSDTTHLMYYRGQRIKEAYYRGEQIWGENLPPHIPFTFVVEVQLESEFYATKGFNTGQGDEYLFGKLPGWYDGDWNNMISRYVFQITVPIPASYKNAEPHEIIPIVSVIWSRINAGGGFVYSRSNDYMKFNINYLILPIKDFANKVEFVYNDAGTIEYRGYYLKNEIGEKGRRWIHFYTRPSSYKLNPIYLDLNPLVRMISYDHAEYNHLWPGIDNPTVRAINYPRYPDDYDPNNPKHVQSYLYYQKVSELYADYANTHDGRVAEDGVINTSDIIPNGLSVYRYYAPFGGSERWPDSYGIYARGFAQDYGMCLENDIVYQDSSLHCDQNLLYGQGVGYINHVNTDEGELKIRKGNAPIINSPLAPPHYVNRRGQPESYVVTNNLVRCGARYGFFQSNDGLYVSEEVMAFLSPNKTANTSFNRGMREAYYPSYNVSGRMFNRIRGVKVSARKPNDIPSVLLSSAPDSWDALYRYSPYYPHAEEQEGENQNE